MKMFSYLLMNKVKKKSNRIEKHRNFNAKPKEI